MDHQGKTPKQPGAIHVISGGAGMSGAQVARTALAQFPDVHVPVVVVAYVKTADQVRKAIDDAAAGDATVIHTLVDGELRRVLMNEARRKNVVAIDLMGPLLSRITHVVGQAPIGQPGLYRQIHQAYFDRMNAIEFAVAHDDGKQPQDLRHAEIIITGPSRMGKTPLSMYLSVRGWRVANVPLIKGMDPPRELSEAPRERVVGLTVEPSQLIAHRELRQRRLGVGSSRKSPYSDALTLHEELEEARVFYRKHGIRTIDVTDKPIEESAEEVISLINRRTS